jgi:hypothetical protein
MKSFTAFVLLLSTLVVSQKVEAQSRGDRSNRNHDRGSRGPGGPSGAGDVFTRRPGNGGVYNDRPSNGGRREVRPYNGGSSDSRGPRYNPNPGSSSPSPGSYTPSRPTPGPSTGGYNSGDRTPRGPRYNPNPGSGTPSPGSYTPSRPTPGPSTGGYNSGDRTPRGPRYNPNPRPTPGSTGGYNPGPVVTRPTPGTPPRGPRYNPRPVPGSTGGYNPGRVVHRPTPGIPSRGPRYNPYPGRGPVVIRPGSTIPRYYPRPTTPSYRVPGHRYNRTVGTYYGRSDNPNYRPIRTHYGTRFYHRPFGYTPIRYVYYNHAPYRATYSHSVRYYRTSDWYNYVLRSYPNYLYAHWIFWPATGYTNGYWTIDNYPYFVYNGYRYRYSSYDYCNYQLVDKYDHRVTQTHWNLLCKTGYDMCSLERDRLNAQMNDYRYFCSETYRDYGHDYSQPSYDDSYYPETTTNNDSEDINTCVDSDRDGMCDEFTDSNSTCSDRDSDGFCDPGTYGLEDTENS